MDEMSATFKRNVLSLFTAGTFSVQYNATFCRPKFAKIRIKYFIILFHKQILKFMNLKYMPAVLFLTLKV